MMSWMVALYLVGEVVSKDILYKCYQASAHPTLSALKSKDGFLVVICKNIQGGGETGGLLGDEEAYLMETEEHWASLLPALFRPV